MRTSVRITFRFCYFFFPELFFVALFFVVLFWVFVLQAIQHFFRLTGLKITRIFFHFVFSYQQKGKFFTR